MREIVAYPDPVLNQVARALTEEEIKAGSFVQGENDQVDLTRLVDEMVEHILRNRAIGLAAPQVGLSVRMIVVQPVPKAAPLPLLNPEIVETHGSEDAKEGCLSLPGVIVSVKRAKKIVVKARALNGDELNFPADDLLARVIQHEIDHLDGTLIITKGNIIGNRRVKDALDDMKRKYERWQERKNKK